MSTAIKTNSIRTDTHIVRDGITDLNTGREAFFYRGNSVEFEINPHSNGVPLEISGGTLTLEIQSEADPSVSPYVSVSSTMLTAPISISLTAAQTDVIPSGRPHMVIRWEDASNNELTLYSGSINVLEDGAGGRGAVVVIAPDTYILNSQRNVADGFAGLDSSGLIEVAQLPAAALVSAFDGNLDADLVLSDPSGTQPEISTTETDGIKLKAAKLDITNAAESVTQTLTPGNLNQTSNLQFDSVSTSTFTAAGQLAFFQSNAIAAGDINNPQGFLGYTTSAPIGATNTIYVSTVGIKTFRVFIAVAELTPDTDVNFFIPNSAITATDHNSATQNLNSNDLIVTTDSTYTGATEVENVFRVLEYNNGTADRLATILVAYRFI